MDATSSFYTKSFFIKFCEEEVELNDFCHFRIELDVGKNGDPADLYLESELMFFDCMNNNKDEKKDEKKDANKK